METLPVELIHRIFDHLDAQTLLLSIRPVCRLFQSIVQTYDRYQLDMHLISKGKFSVLCRLVAPENVISLTLSNDERTSDQIERFLSMLSLRQFTRLRSLTLQLINENQLEILLKNSDLNLLNSFSCKILNDDEVNETTTRTTIDLLSSLICQSPLRQLNLSIPDHLMLDLSWLIHSTIHSLTINCCIKINNLHQICQCSPHLQKLSLDRVPLVRSVENLNFSQLKSLTIDNVDTSIDKLELFLLLTPSLTYLQLIGRPNMIDGKYWEDFIGKHLPHLSKFEFYFTQWESHEQTLADIQLIINSFQTSFWIEEKSWFVTCESSKAYPKTVYLSSLPFCQSSAYYQAQSDKISLSTYPIMMNNGLRMIDNIHSLGMHLNSSIAMDIRQKVFNNSILHYSFRIYFR